MSVKTIEVEVAEATYNLVSALGHFCTEAYKAAKDGFQPFSDVPAVLQAAMVDLIPQMGKVSAVVEEVTKTPVQAGTAVVLAVKTVVEKFVK